MPDPNDTIAIPQAEDRDPFPGTRWSMVLGAGEGERDALEQLCQKYWYPLYIYVRRRGLGAEDAQDRVQGFFSDILRRGDLTRRGTRQ